MNEKSKLFCSAAAAGFISASLLFLVAWQINSAKTTKETLGAIATVEYYRNQAIKNGCGHYNSETGQFEWNIR